MTKLKDVLKKVEMLKWKGTTKKLKEELKITKDHDENNKIKECPKCHNSDLLELSEAEKILINLQGDNNVIGCSECDYWEFKD